MSEVKTFAKLNLIEPLARAVADQGYEIPTPIQAQAIPPLLKGRDLLGCAQTGTGKTAAFALPVLQGLDASYTGQKHIRVLVMTPTRELAAQIDDSFTTYSRHLRITSTVIFGGVNQSSQERALRKKPDILVATPGRLLDLMGQGLISLKNLDYFILDEADRMLDMGFIHDVRRVIDALPAKRQSLFFSATMPDAVAKLADRMLTNPVRIEVAPQSTTADRIEQTLLFVDKNNKRRLLETLLLKKDNITRALVFSRTKRGADRICKDLRHKKISADAIHGNKSQNARTRALDGFRQGNLRVLVATDIAARGIDVEGVSHVINFDLPNEPESYVHRIGRTARAGQAGQAISFCAGDERDYLKDIEKIIKKEVPVNRDHDFHSEDASKGLENGMPAETPHQRQGRLQAERAQQRQKHGHQRPARHGGEENTTHHAKPRSKNAAGKQRRRQVGRGR